MSKNKKEKKQDAEKVQVDKAFLVGAIIFCVASFAGILALHNYIKDSSSVITCSIIIMFSTIISIILSFKIRFKKKETRKLFKRIQNFSSYILSFIIGGYAFDIYKEFSKEISLLWVWIVLITMPSLWLFFNMFREEE